ncbi:MAG: hypothetical protein K2X57_24050 [Xanthobacteraceae bacterium]|nr:hypothetical protein [Xanthobacteraceae bacterium]
MTSHLELSSRAALCRELARREPNSKTYWLAEAESWLRLSRKPSHPKQNGQRDAFEQFLDLMVREDGES